MLSNEEKFYNVVNKINRKGINDLVEYIEQQTDFFIAPASTKYHSSYSGGLLQHSLNVYENLNNLTTSYDYDTIAICGLFHDICKTNMYEKSSRNRKGVNGWETYEVYTVNNTYPMGHGEKSVIILSKFIKLTDEEAMAINWHMGGFDVRSSGFDISDAFSKCNLAVYLHMADLQSTYINEH